MTKYCDGYKLYNREIKIAAHKLIDGEIKSKTFRKLSKAEKWIGSSRAIVIASSTADFLTKEKETGSISSNIYRFIYKNGIRKNFRTKSGRFNAQDYYCWNNWNTY